MLLETVYLKHVPTDQIVEAELHGDLPDELMIQWEERWIPAMKTICAGRLPGKKPEDSHWDWRKKAEITRGFLAYNSYAIMCGGELQGLMITRDIWAARHQDQFGKPTIYIEFVASAPWNRPEAGGVRYRGVGVVFLATAISQSCEMDYRGRIALHSLPSAEIFYRKQGLIELGRDSSHQNLKYFEMTEEGAREFMRRQGKS